MKNSYQQISGESDRIGVMVSGGIDSGLLLYYLLRMDPKKIIPFTVPRADNAAEHGQRMVEVIYKKLGLPIKNTTLIGDPLSRHHSEQVLDGIESIFEKKLCDTLFLADNITPKNQLSNEKWTPKRVRSDVEYVRQPFFDLTKDLIVKAIQTENLDFIFIESHSCTEKIHGRCNQCWQCRERIWAFKAARLSDPGVK